MKVRKVNLTLQSISDRELTEDYLFFEKYKSFGYEKEAAEALAELKRRGIIVDAAQTAERVNE